MNEFPTLLCNGVPCAVIGTKDQFENFIAGIIGCEPGIEGGQQHVSDMHSAIKLGLPSVDLCREYGTNGFESAKLIHFSHASRHGRKRSEIMKEWLHDKFVGIEPKQFTNEQLVESFSVNEEAKEEPAAQPLHTAPTIAGQLRFHAEAMKKIANCQSRKLTAVRELRKVGLIPQAARRKRKKWPGFK